MTLADAQLALTATKEAYFAALGGKSYTINLGGTSRSVTRNDAEFLRKEWERWELIVSNLQNGRRGIPTRFITPVM